MLIGPSDFLYADKRGKCRVIFRFQESGFFIWTFFWFTSARREIKILQNAPWFATVLSFLFGGTFCT